MYWAQHAHGLALNRQEACQRTGVLLLPTKHVYGHLYALTMAVGRTIVQVALHLVGISTATYVV